MIRVRVGIGRPPAGIDPVEHVLRPFTAEELATVDDVVSRACDAVYAILDNGPEWAMDQFNRIQ
jgi:PTH1 family peptidyl-tRNA hydrolase